MPTNHPLSKELRALLNEVFDKLQEENAEFVIVAGKNGRFDFSNSEIDSKESPLLLVDIMRLIDKYLEPFEE